MCQAMITPLIEKKIQPPGRFMVYDVNLPVLDRIRSIHPDIAIAATMPDCVQDADLVLCAVKPQNLTPDFREQLLQTNNSNAILLSVIAGKSLATLRSDTGFVKVVRSMPNTPATISAGMTVFATTHNLTTSERTQIERVLSGCGETVRESWIGRNLRLLCVCAQLSRCVLVAFCALRCTWMTNDLLTWPRAYRDLGQLISSC